MSSLTKKIIVLFCLIWIVYGVSFTSFTVFPSSEEIAHDDGTAENFMANPTTRFIAHPGCFLVKFYVEKPVSILKIRLYLANTSTSDFAKGSISVYVYNNIGWVHIGSESIDLAGKNLSGVWFDTFNRRICNSIVNGTFYVACTLPEDFVLGLDTNQPDNNSIAYPGGGTWYYNQHSWETQTDKKFMVRVLTSTSNFSIIGVFSLVPTAIVASVSFLVSTKLSRRRRRLFNQRNDRVGREQTNREKAERERVYRARAENESHEKEKATYERQPTYRSADDPFAVLGVPRNATKSQVCDAYRRLAMEWHPDKFAKHQDSRVIEMANERFIKIKDAYEEVKRIKGWT